MSLCRASVVVPTFDRPDLIRRCLDALRGQEWRDGRFEVFVVDDGHSDEVRRIVETAARPDADFIYRRSSRRASGPAAARNIGWRLARAPVVAFTDDDCIPQASWLLSGMEALNDGAAGAWGHVIVPLGPEPTDYELDVAGLEHAPFATACCFYRREALEAVSGFDERFSLAWREDSDLHFSMLESGMQLVRAPATALVIHPVRAASWGISLRQQKKTQFEALLYRKHPLLYRSQIRPGPIWSYYAMVAAGAAAAAAAMLDHTGASTAALGAWGFLTARFCARRLEGTSRSPSHLAEMAFTSPIIPPLSLFWRLVGAIRFGAFVL